MPINQTESTNIVFTRRDWLLIALTFATGAIDAISYFGLGKIFSAFMTGNLVFLGFGLANAGGPELLPVIVAVGMFSVGAHVGTWSTRSSPAGGIWSRPILAIMGFVGLLEAIFFAVWVATAANPTQDVCNTLIGLLALAMGLQMAAVRALHVPGVFTTAATFTLLAFFGDFAGSRPTAEAPRLGGTLVALVLGAFGGGLLFRYAPIYVPALPLAITIVAVLVGLRMTRGNLDTRTSAAR